MFIILVFVGVVYMELNVYFYDWLYVNKCIWYFEVG